MQLALVDDLPFATIILTYQDNMVEISNVLFDTGSATTVLAADQVAQIGLVPAPVDILYTMVWTSSHALGQSLIWEN